MHIEVYLYLQEYKVLVNVTLIGQVIYATSDRSHVIPVA